jgi:hypothetical protein
MKVGFYHPHFLLEALLGKHGSQAKKRAQDKQEPSKPVIPGVLIVNDHSGHHQTPTSAIDMLESVIGE